MHNTERQALATIACASAVASLTARQREALVLVVLAGFTQEEAAEHLGVPPQSLAVFEDSANGILAGLAAGAYTIAVPNPYAQPPANVLARADRVLGSLREFALDMLP